MNIKYILLLLVLFCTMNGVVAQPWDHDDPWGVDPGEEEEVPIDGGAVALLVGSAALGYKALKKKKEETEED